ncbi:MAG: nucleoside/nucleotide kinase family protein [Paracoccaceae bacterium]
MDGRNGHGGEAERVNVSGLKEWLIAWGPGPRRIVAIAGAPGSGKSTTAGKIVGAVNRARPGTAALLPMDGFHYDDAVLREMKRLPWKGAPDTFDVGGLRALLERLRRNDEDFVAVPVFDRSIEIARAGGRLIPQAADIIVCEGNYLLLDRAPWTALRPFFDLKVLIEVSEPVLRARLTRRWEGFGMDAEGVRRKLEENDLPNGRAVIAESRGADLILAT